MKILLRYWSLPVGFLGATILFFVATLIFKPSEPRDRAIEFVLMQNETARTIAFRLKKDGIIDNPTKFILLAKLFNYERKLKKGKYNLSKGMDEFSTLRILSKSRQAGILVTIPEGKTLEQIAEILEKQNICSKKDFLIQATDKTFLLSAGINAKSAEGYLFPDSYEFEIQSDPKTILTRMIKHFFSIYDSLSGELKDNQLSRIAGFSDHEIVTLASIVETEAQLNSERPIIASVFLNRMKRRLPLQSCATVAYILKKRKPRLSLQDLSIMSPYNTYLHFGLPPGPICNPGRNSLRAVLFPAKTDYLYFVSRGDGSHQFSKTSKEHQAAIKRYQKDLD